MGGEAEVLVLTQDFDPTVDPVVRSLTAKGARVVRVDTSYFPRSLSFTTSDFDGADRAVMRHHDGDVDREVDLTALAGVWYRRPTAFDFGEEMGEAEREFARHEALHGIGGILRSTDCLWMNRPDLDAVADLKPYQLKLAKQAGLRVPRTLLTNDPDEVARLVKQEGEGSLVYKSLSGGVVHYPGAFPSGLYTAVLGEEIHDHLPRVRHTLCQFQEYIEKAYEVRLTIIGDAYFPVVIDSQGGERTRIDWRADTELRYGDYRPLPEDVVRRTQTLMDRLGLVYAAVDFIVTPDGEHVFLESNPNGQFMWMQNDLGLPLGDRIADLLMRGGPFRRGEVEQVGY
ncbi:MvdC/MvdD family ATP grasp protein [Actinomadura luteofluorescens]|uniref:MvdC/MvdD family ATP grasp protein n=1 Tax=Actinomadura luteofluorescens TaxID=46163 RepID=UPI003D92D828